MHSFSLHLESKVDLIRYLRETASNENKFGYVLGVVGNISVARFKCPEKEKPTVIKGNLEIITLNGTLSPNGCHIHISVSDSNCRVWGGHLEEGTKTLKGADILVGFLDNKSIRNSLQSDKSINIPKTIEVYTISNCPWSSRAVRMLRTLQIAHNVKNIESDDQFRELNQITNYSTFPQIIIDGEFIGGYAELAELHAKGRLSN